jgi:hypothetical protein
MLVEDPENVVAGRYALTREQKAEAARTAGGALELDEGEGPAEGFIDAVRRCGCGSADLFASSQRAEIASRGSGAPRAV